MRGAFSEKDSMVCSLIDSIYDGVVIADRDGFIRYVNNSYLTITKLHREDVIDQPLSKVRPGSVLSQVIQSGEGKRGFFRKEGGSEYVVDMAPLLVRGKIVGGISIVKAIEQVQQLSKKLEDYIEKNHELKAAVSNSYQARYTLEQAIGVSKVFQDTLKLARQMADYDEDILIVGESGTGKELFAQGIHNCSGRRNRPFVAVNCPTLQESLAESELFGYIKGAFTGALKEGRVGLFFVADKGTILLDEIADLPLEMQAKLLRVLQERRIRRIGSSREEQIDVRVIAATNQELSALVKAGKFREDLYYRLAAMTLELPSIRDRKEDLKPLANYFLKLWGEKRGQDLTIAPTVYEAMYHYDWPGNVRELRNVIQFSAYACSNDVLTELHLPKRVKEKEHEAQISPLFTGSLKNILQETEEIAIGSLLKIHGDTLEGKRKVASQLKISLATLYNKMKAWK